MLVGAVIAHFTPEPLFSTGPRTLAADTSATRIAEASSRAIRSPGEATPRVEYLLRDGRRAYKHSDLGFVAVKPDEKVIKAALHVSCEAISGGLPCR